MLTIAIDTSTPTGSVSLFERGAALIGEVRLGIKRPHSEQIMKSADFILNSCKIKLDAIDFFTIAIGPGSFTGLRVGLSTVKGLSFATGKPIVAVSTLEAFAASFPYTEKLICPLLDARKKEVYGGLFKWTERGFRRVIPESAFDIKTLIAGIKEETIFAGSGAMLYKDAIIKALGKKAYFPPENLMYPLPLSFCILGIQKAEMGEFSDPIKLVPMYIRRSEAEIKTKT